MNRLPHYLAAMAAKNRLLYIVRDNQVIGWTTVWVGSEDDIYRFHHREMFSLTHDDPNGEIVYMDYLVCSEWNKEIRNLITSQLAQKFPNHKKLVWYRPTTTFDRKVEWSRPEATNAIL